MDSMGYIYIHTYISTHTHTHRENTERDTRQHICSNNREEVMDWIGSGGTEGEMGG